MEYLHWMILRFPPAGHGPSLRTILEKPQHPDGGPGALHAAARYGHAEARQGQVVRYGDLELIVN